MKAAYAMVVVGVCINFATAMYHLFWRPEWTQAQALHRQWIPFLIGFTLIVAGAVLGCWTDRDSRRR